MGEDRHDGEGYGSRRDSSRRRLHRRPRRSSGRRRTRCRTALVSGRAAPGATPRGRAGRRPDRRQAAAGRPRRFPLDVALPARARSRVRVETVDRARPPRGPHRARTCSGCPARRGRDSGRRGSTSALQRARAAARRSASRSTSGIYVQNLATGAAAAWNARATFPAASTLKLAIAVTSLARDERPAGAGIDARPAPAADADRLRQRGGELRARLARRLDERRSAPRQRADAVDRARATRRCTAATSIGTSLDPSASRRPAASRCASSSQPRWGVGKTTTALDLAQLASRGLARERGPRPARPAQRGPHAAEARYLLYLLAHVRGPSKIGREVPAAPASSCSTRPAGSTPRATTRASSSGGRDRRRRRDDVPLVGGRRAVRRDVLAGRRRGGGARRVSAAEPATAGG